MQGLRIVSRDGSAVGQDEIDAAHRVVATFGGRAFGTPSATDDATGVRVEYHAHKNLAIVEPSGVDYRLVSFPSPWPGKRLSVIHVETSTNQFDVLVSCGDGEFVASTSFNFASETMDNPTGNPPDMEYGWDGTTEIPFWSTSPPHAQSRLVPFTVPPDCIFSDLEYRLTSAVDSAFRSRMVPYRVAWSESKTDDTISMAPSGGDPVWPEWDTIIKRSHPVSVKWDVTYKPGDVPFSKTISDTFSSTSPVVTLQNGIQLSEWTETTTRTVTSSFRLYDDSGGAVEMVDSQVGTMIEQFASFGTSMPRFSSDQVYCSQVTRTYDNWYQELSTNHMATALPQDRLGAHLPLHADTRIVPISMGFQGAVAVSWTGTEISYEQDEELALYRQFYKSDTTPAPRSNSITWTIPLVVDEYLRLLPMRQNRSASFDNTTMAPNPDRAHEIISTSHRSAARVDAILFGAVRAGQRLGLYWQREWDVDSADHLIDGVDVYGILRMRWDTARGRLVVGGMTPVQSPNPSDPTGTPLRVMFASPIPHLDKNVVLRFSGLKYPDMREKGETLRGYLAESPPAHASEVADMLGTQWAPYPPERVAVQTLVAGILAAIGDL